MASKSQSSINLLSDGGSGGSGDKPLKCGFCEKTYSRESWLKAHMKKIHGVEGAEGLDGLDVTEWEPAATSTAENFAVKEEEEDAPVDPVEPYPMIKDLPKITEKMAEKKMMSKKRMRSSTDEEDIGNLESARKAKENRLAMREQLQIERDLQMGYDGLDDVGDGQGQSTQSINAGLRETLKEAENTVFGDISGNVSVEVGVGQALVDLDVENKSLKKLLGNKETKIVDLEVKVSEINDQMDAKDRVVKELREVVKLKNGEINDLVKEVEGFNVRLKRSPLKEELKANSLKAEWKIKQQAERIKNLEQQLKKESAKARPEIEKLKKQSLDQLTRAEHYTREEVRHLNTIASLRKKIPCGDLPGCEQGKKCAYSHILKYAKPDTGKLKLIPCVHFMNGRCKFQNEEDCKYAHPRNGTIELEDEDDNEGGHSSRYQQQLQESVASARSESAKELSRRPSFSRMSFHKPYSNSSQGSGSKPSAKRFKLVDDYSSGNSCATDKFPEPVPSLPLNMRKRTRSEASWNNWAHEHSGPNNNKEKVSGNGRGAQGKRSPLMVPDQRRGSRGTPRGTPRGPPRPSYPSRGSSQDKRRYSPPRHSSYRERSEDVRGSWNQESRQNGPGGPRRRSKW